MKIDVANLIYLQRTTNLFLRVLVQLLLNTAKYHYLFEGHNIFEYQIDLLNKPETYDKGVKDSGLNAVLWL